MLQNKVHTNNIFLPSITAIYSYYLCTTCHSRYKVHYIRLLTLKAYE